MKDIMKIIKSLEDSGLLMKDISKIIKNEAKEQNWVFLGILLRTLGASLLGNLLTGKDAITAGKKVIAMSPGQRTIGAVERKN